jgi:Tol biopolymer transport system component
MTIQKTTRGVLFALPALVLLSAPGACASAPPRREAARPAPAPDLVSRITTLRQGGARLDWLGNRIAFDMRGPDGHWAVYTMRADGGDVRCVSCEVPALPKRNVGQPAWHPSGRFMVVQAEKEKHTRIRMGRVVTPGAGVLNDLWLIDVDGRNATLLRDVGDTRGDGTLHAHFSKDGNRLSWTEMQEPGGIRKGKEMGYWALMTADFRTTGGKPRLENVRSYTPGGNAFYENHGFSPDGSQILFSSNYQARKRFEGHIYLMDLATQRVTRLTTQDYNEHGSFSPDGSTIAWISTTGNRNNGTDYWLMNRDGSNKRRLTWFNSPGHGQYTGKKVVVADLSWRPDGGAIAAYYREGGPALETSNSELKIILIELRSR